MCIGYRSSIKPRCASRHSSRLCSLLRLSLPVSCPEDPKLPSSYSRKGRVHYVVTLATVAAAAKKVSAVLRPRVGALD